MPRCTSWDYKHLWLCLNHLVVCESDNGIKLYSDTCFMCLCGVAGGVCWGLAWGHSASSVRSVEPQVAVCSSLTSHQFSCKARLGWRIPADARKRLKPLSKRQPTHLLCLSLIQFHIQNDKTVYVALWGSIGTTWTIWSWFKWGGLLTESQQLHIWFWRKAGVSSTGCALALDLSLGCKPANAGDMEGPVFDSWNTESSSVSDLYSQEIHR